MLWWWGKCSTYRVLVQTCTVHLLFGCCCEPISLHALTCISLLCVYTSCIFNCFSAAEVTFSNLTLASRTATTLNVTWSAGYPKCYSFTVSHSTQDGFITVTQPANSDTFHTLTSLQPGTTYRIEVEAVRKRGGIAGQRAKVVANFTPESEGEKWWRKRGMMLYYGYILYSLIYKAPVPSSTTSTVYHTRVLS